MQVSLYIFHVFVTFDCIEKSVLCVLPFECSPFPYHDNHKTFRHCRVRFYASVGQPFSRQLFIVGNVQQTSETVAASNTVSALLRLRTASVVSAKATAYKCLKFANVLLVRRNVRKLPKT